MSSVRGALDDSDGMHVHAAVSGDRDASSPKVDADVAAAPITPTTAARSRRRRSAGLPRQPSACTLGDVCERLSAIESVVAAIDERPFQMYAMMLEMTAQKPATPVHPCLGLAGRDVPTPPVHYASPGSCSSERSEVSTRPLVSLQQLPEVPPLPTFMEARDGACPRNLAVHAHPCLSDLVSPPPALPMFPCSSLDQKQDDPTTAISTLDLGDVLEQFVRDRYPSAVTASAFANTVSQQYLLVRELEASLEVHRDAVISSAYVPHYTLRRRCGE